ncbi:fimbrial protein [Stenotrophomonas rhizophila]|uniref:fimbrial protein n=1 Tax=Stenotrophomonas rhizophila TaxID=216778 RepID=UPI00226C5885|nr:fimbrial protein [Stenotrophomonas rhizophila]MCC7634887.1 type 1 fimbrial protein [Stenotrophomonas rhizophila]MCC7664440.1 type 1 fimbrial protein [Stenotrophomonas rhizophila]
MKLSTIATALTAALAAAAVAPAMAADGKVTINGEITATTCDINAGGTGSPNQTVTLPTVSTTALNAAGKTAGEKEFHFDLSGSTCAGTAKMHFESATSPVDLATSNLDNQATNNPAKYVQVSILNADGSKVALADSSNSQSVTIDPTTNTARMSYFARYEAVGQAAEQGMVSTFFDYSIDYN